MQHITNQIDAWNCLREQPGKQINNLIYWGSNTNIKSSKEILEANISKTYHIFQSSNALNVH